MSEGVDNSGADTQTRERAGAAHEGDFGDVVKSFVVFGELALQKAEEFFSHVVAELFVVFVVV